VIHGSLDGLELRQLPGRRAADPLPATAAAGVATRVVEVEAGPRTAHRHPDGPEVIHVLAGRGEHWQEGERVAVAPGDLLLVPTGRAHATVAAAGGTLRLLCFFPFANVAAGTEELDAEVPAAGG
jgi:quercetin dioxygenase-like cupin family protein